MTLPSLKRISSLTLFSLGFLLVLALAMTSYLSHQDVSSMHLKEIVAQHRQEWLDYHEARELKRKFDAEGLWGKPADTLSITIYKPEAYARALKMHQEEEK